jgi:hypothetical protein
MVEAGWQGFEQDTERVELGDEPSVQIAVHIVGKSESEQAVEADSEFEVRVCRSSAGEVYEIENAEGVVWRVRNSVKYLTTLENIARALECTYLDLQKDLPVEALIGHESYVSAAPRIITDGADTGWLADTHWAVSSRILSLCSHGVQRAVDVGPVRGPGSNHVIASWLNRIPELMRGVRCALTTRNAGHHHFYAMRNTWMAFRDLMSFSNSLRPPTKQNLLIVYGDEYSDRRALWTRALQCGASLPDIAAAAIDPQMTRRLKASALDGLIQNLRPEDSWAATLNLIESNFLPVAIELFLFLGVLKYVASDMRSKGGQIYATDLSDHLFNEQLEESFDFEGGDPDDALESWILQATGCQCIGDLDPVVKLDSHTGIADHAAGDLGEALLVASESEVPGLLPGPKFTIDRTVPKSVMTHHNGSKIHISRVGAGQLIAYRSGIAQKVTRLISRLKMVQISGFGLEADLSSLSNYTIIDGHEIVNLICSGDFKTDYGSMDYKVITFFLKLVFRHGFKVNKSGGPTCFLPNYAHHSDGYVITSFLTRQYFARCHFTAIDGHIYWCPGDGLSLFKLKRNWRNKKDHLTECPELNVRVSIVGRIRPGYRVGCDRKERAESSVVCPISDGRCENVVPL